LIIGEKFRETIKLIEKAEPIERCKRRPAGLREEIAGLPTKVAGSFRVGENFLR